ncbi:MAG: hypothetical protein QXW70_01565 [Candidatus Anstonellales archaeon]
MRIRSLASLFFVFSLLLIQSVDAQQTVDENVEDFIGRFQGFAAPIGAALLIGVGATAIAYMLSEFLAVPNIKSWAKMELYEVFITGVIVIITFFTLGLFSMISQIIGGSADIYMRPSIFLDSMFWMLVSKYISLNLNEIVLGMVSTLHSTFFFPPHSIMRFSISFGPGVGVVPVAEGNILITDLVGGAIGLISLQKVLLLFFKDSMLSVFLPLGLFLRAFFITRRIGSSIIAFAFTAYFVFPLSVIVVEELYINTQMPQIREYEFPLTIEPNPQAGNFMNTVVEEGREASRRIYQNHEDERSNESGGWCSGQPQNWGFFRRIICGAWRLLSAVVEVTEQLIDISMNYIRFTLRYVSSLASLWRSSVIFYYATVETMNEIGWSLSFVFVGVVIEIILTVTAYRSIAASIGGEVEIFGLSKLV